MHDERIPASGVSSTRGSTDKGTMSNRDDGPNNYRERAAGQSERLLLTPLRDLGKAIETDNPSRDTGQKGKQHPPNDRPTLDSSCSTPCKRWKGIQRTLEMALRGATEFKLSESVPSTVPP